MKTLENTVAARERAKLVLLAAAGFEKRRELGGGNDDQRPNKRDGLFEPLKPKLVWVSKHLLATEGKIWPDYAPAVLLCQ
jgi:hypothetical protein